VKILLGFHYYPYAVDVAETTQCWADSIARELNVTIDCVPLNIDPPSQRLSWPALDKRWSRGERTLMDLYEDLGNRLADYDVFLNWNGINTHPRFVEQLDCVTAYGCFDDPESSEDLSRPVAASYDVCLVGNVAELDTYRSWGCRSVHFWPNGFRNREFDPTLTRQRILEEDRDVAITLLCERVTDWRGKRLDTWTAAFPHGHYHGPGWDAGFLPEEDKVPLYQRTRIAPNFHNSTGPINYRTFTAPANGMLLLCDNKHHLGQVFVDGEEAVGFETVEEAIELAHHYLANEDERRRVAAAGFERALRDYNEIAVFRRALDAVAPLLDKPRPTLTGDITEALRRHRKRTAVKRTAVRFLKKLRTRP
jgi:hypothetical protein